MGGAIHLPIVFIWKFDFPRIEKCIGCGSLTNLFFGALVHTERRVVSVGGGRGLRGAYGNRSSSLGIRLRRRREKIEKEGRIRRREMVVGVWFRFPRSGGRGGVEFDTKIFYLSGTEVGKLNSF